MKFLVLFVGKTNFTAPLTLTLKTLHDSIPSFLKFVFKHQIRSGCGTVDQHRTTGDILLGCLGGMKIYSRDSGEVRHVTYHVRARVVEYKGEVFISHHDDNETVIKVIKYDTAKKTSEFLFSFPMKSINSYFLSVSDHFIASLDTDNNTIKLYNRQTGNRSGSDTLTTLTLPEYHAITNFTLRTDHTLLVTGWEKDKTKKLNKYRVNGDRLHLIWSCRDVPDVPAGIAVDDRGRIYVSGCKTKTIYVLSDEGEILLKFSLIHRWSEGVLGLSL